MKNISLFYEDINFTLPNQQQTLSWIYNIILEQKMICKELNYIFCSDKYVLEINRKYLNHDYYTDIITFDNSENQGEIESDIYISIDRVGENSEKLNIDFIDELHRVMIHGILHLFGLKDQAESEKNEMRKSEDHYLALRKF